MDNVDSGTPATPASPPPGWYPHPAEPGRELYWDGATWVADTTRPLVMAPAELASDQARSDEAGSDEAPAAPAADPSAAAVPTNQFGTPLPAAEIGTPPAPSTGATYPGGYAGAPAPGPSGPVESPAKAAAPSFLLGALVAIGVSVLGLWVIQSHSSGVFWFGGYFVTLVAWRRSWAYYKATSARTGSGLTTPQKAIVAVLAGTALMLTAAFAVQYIGVKTAPKLTAAVGSCWADSGDKVRLVECSDSSAAYVATSTALTQDSCPTSAEGSISDNGTYYCLTRR
jgi:hypothetical protein